MRRWISQLARNLADALAPEDDGEPNLRPSVPESTPIIKEPASRLEPQHLPSSEVPPSPPGLLMPPQNISGNIAPLTVAVPRTLRNSRSHTTQIVSINSQSVVNPPTTLLSLRENCTLSLAGVIAELAPIPHSGLLINGLTAIFQAVEKSRVNREQWKLLRGRCVMVCRTAGIQVENYQREHYPELQNVFGVLSTAIIQISSSACRWNRTSELLTFLHFSDISEEIRSHFITLDSCLSLFSYNARAARMEWINDFNSIQTEELTRLEGMRVFMQEMGIQVDTIAQNPSMFASLEGEIKERLERAMIQKFEMLQSSVTTELADYVEAQQIVQTIHTIVDIQLPPILLVGNQCTLESNLPVRSGVTCDIYPALFLDTEKVAKKVFRVGTSEREAVERYARRLIRDAKLWATIKCEYTLPFYGIGMETSGHDEKAWQLYMLSPLMPNFDAVIYLKRYRDNPNMKEGIMRIITEAAEGLKYLHSRSPPVVHSGMRGDNILITDSGGAILGGFGLTKALSGVDAPPAVMTGRTDSYRWLAPELFSDDIPVLQTQSDIWSWGMAALELISGRVPYYRSPQIWQVMTAINANKPPARGDYEDFAKYALKPDEMWSLLERCWAINPMDRPTMDEVVVQLRSMLYKPTITETMVSSRRITFPLSSFRESVPISRLMSAAEVISQLCDHGCQDITTQLDGNPFNDLPTFQGGSGDVYQARLFGGERVAVKTLRMICWINDGVNDFGGVARELHTWSKCDHPNVLKLLGLARFGNQIGMVSPWMELGNLPHYLHQHPEADHYQISIKICEGLVYLHNRHIVHGDLKGLNVLVSSDGTPMLTDFSNAELKDRTLRFTKHNSSTPSLTLRWAAPELLENTCALSVKTDIYALGMTILEIITGDVPWPDKDERFIWGAVVVKKEAPNRPDSMSTFGNRVWPLLIQCWSGDPEQRPNASEVASQLKAMSRDGV